MTHKDELTQLDVGLALANDKDFALPDDIKKEFERYEITEIWGMIDQAKSLDRAVKIRAGFAYMALKERLGERKFKTTLEERDGKGGYYAAWRCMSYARAALHLPNVAQTLGFRCIKKALALPPAQLDEIQEKVTGMPAEIAKDITEEAIDAEYNEMQRRKQARAKQRTPARQTPKPLPKLNMDAPWAATRERWIEAVKALGALLVAAESVEMKPEYFDEVFNHPSGHWCAQLGSYLDRLNEILCPYEELKRRGLNEE
ncbi:MAG: hypothetical protein HY695_30710 [Deltaproteobacteria bacterium]|nr:hypothetical protein [Deltaproteobacteria bacterium]